MKLHTHNYYDDKKDKSYGSESTDHNEPYKEGLFVFFRSSLFNRFAYRHLISFIINSSSYNLKIPLICTLRLIIEIPAFISVGTHRINQEEILSRHTAV